MKANLDQLQLADYGLTEMTAPEMKEANGGAVIPGIIPAIWYAVWGAVYSVLDVLAPGVPFLKNLLQAIVGGVPNWD